jgi:hypothetical protein
MQMCALGWIAQNQGGGVMPCYLAWNENLEPGSAEYADAESEVRAKLQSIKHIVDYYYEVNGAEKPNLPGRHDDRPAPAA